MRESRERQETSLIVGSRETGKQSAIKGRGIE
jgi:hypothetical protein